MENRVTVKEAAEILGVSPRRVHALIEDGRIPVERFGNVFAIKASDLALVSERKAGRPKKEGAAASAVANGSAGTKTAALSKPTKKAATKAKR